MAKIDSSKACIAIVGYCLSTQQDVADALGICRTAIAHYENGTTLPYTKSIDKLCEILNLTYEELFKP